MRAGECEPEPHSRPVDKSIQNKGCFLEIPVHHRMSVRMRVLMIAPEPVFEPRGTPMSVVGRLKALSDMGHAVDLVTYPMGQPVNVPDVRFLRIPAVPGVRRVKIGPSPAKIPLDLLLFFRTVIQLFKKRYDLIHTHEEAGFWGVPLSRMMGIPHIYDMHSSLPQQLKNFRFSNSRILFRLFESLERWILKYSSQVITICPDLEKHVRSLFPERDSVMIENVIDYGMIFGEEDRSGEIRADLGLKGRRVALYAGTFEPYQGIDMLIQSAAGVSQNEPGICFVLVGGHPEQVAHYKNRVHELGLDGYFIFTGQVLPQEVSSYINIEEILLSPRISGTNTPLKLYSYLRSGVPIVATRLLTHTQVLNDEVACLVEPTPEGLAQGMLTVLRSPSRARKWAVSAKKLAGSRYSYAVYLDRLGKAIDNAMERGV